MSYSELCRHRTSSLQILVLLSQSLIRLVLTKQNARKESSEKDEEQKEKPKDKDSKRHSSASHKLLITIYSNTFL